MKYSVADSSWAPVRAAVATAAIIVCTSPSASVAGEVDTGNPDVKLRWDNTVRYNLGIRAKDCDSNICGNGTGLAGDVSAHQSDRKFSKAGNVIGNRFDLFSEVDVIYKESSGVRVSAAAWYDDAYRNSTASGDPAFLAAGFNSFSNGQYTDYIKRYNHSSGEFLDAFVFTKFDLGAVPVNVKLGQHNVYWGESLFSFVGGVAYGQGPVDIRKALSNPGSEAKELFKPLPQASFSAALSDRLTLAGQYFFDWKPSTLPDGGTYFGPADFFTGGGGTQVPLLTPVFGQPGAFIGTSAPDKKRGDWGLALKWRPEWLDGSAGVYYREYTDKLPQMVINGFTATGAPTIALDYKTPRQKMLGFSLAKQISGVSVGSDVTFRKDAQIGATAFSPAFLAGPGVDWRPRGDVFTALVNAIAYFGKNPVFDSAALTAELNYSNLLKVTNDPMNFYLGLPANCGGEATRKGCPTKSAVGLAIQFEPKWFQVLPGTDISMPMFLGVGLKGNSPVPFGDNKGQGSYSIGISADAQQKYNVTLKYNGFLARHSRDQLGIGSLSNSSLGKYWDRDFVSLTFKTTF